MENQKIKHYTVDFYNLSNLPLNTTPSNLPLNTTPPASKEHVQYPPTTQIFQNSIRAANCEILNIKTNETFEGPHDKNIDVVITIPNGHCTLYVLDKPYNGNSYCSFSFYGLDELDFKKSIDFLINEFNPKKIRMIELQQKQD